VFRPFNGFADNIPVDESYVTLPDAPGIGFELKNELFAVMKDLAGR
jgi:D(-)-tartrate dehydratase